MTSAHLPLQIYPEHCHSLSPTIGKWCPLAGTDVVALQDVGFFSDGRILYHHGNHPVKWVRLTGLVVGVDDFKRRRIYTVDDSSGVCVECVANMPAEVAETSAAAIPKPKHLNQLVQIGRQAASTTTSVSTSTTGASRAKVQDTAKTAPSVFAPHVPWAQIDVGLIVKVKGKIGEFRGNKQIEVIKMEVINGLDAEVKCWNEVKDFRRDVLRHPWAVAPEEEEKCRKAKEKERRRANRKKESDEARKKRKASERDAAKKKETEDRMTREKTTMPPPPAMPSRESKGRSKYPSLAAVIKAAGGKYDALGI